MKGARSEPGNDAGGHAGEGGQPAPQSSQSFFVSTVMEASAMAICRSVMEIASISCGCSAFSAR